MSSNHGYGGGTEDQHAPDMLPVTPHADPLNQSASNYQPSQSTPNYQHPGYLPTNEHPSAQTVFILSLIGIPVTICAFIAWYMGAKAKKEIDAGAPYRWEGNLKTGYWIGKVISIVAIVGIVLWIVLMAFAVASLTMQ